MARSKRGATPNNTPSPSEPAAQAPQKPDRPLIFISHDHRDAELAEAFANLLTDASGGFLKSFRSSDKKGTAGIEFGAEWYSEIMGKISDATDVVALLTNNSIDRPWILYEAGVAKGKLDKPVFGVVVGVPFESATRGPFAQFQNCGDEEDSLTKLVLQLIKRNSDAEPRDEAIQRQVAAFRTTKEKLSQQKRPVPKEKSPPAEVDSVAKLFEEVKIMFRDLPDRLHGQVNESTNARFKRRKRFRAIDFYEFVRFAGLSEVGGRDVAWLLAIGMIRDELPWVYELGKEVYNALRTDNDFEIETAVKKFDAALSLVRRGPMQFFADSDEAYFLINELRQLAGFLFAMPAPIGPKAQERKLQSKGD